MKRAMLDRLAERVLDVAMAGEPYRDAIVGDLVEQRHSIERHDGEPAARRWYCAQVVRTSLALLRFSPPRRIATGIVIAASAYWLAVTLSSPAAFALMHAAAVRGPVAQIAAYFAVIAIFASTAGALTVARRGTPLVSSAVFIAISIGFGARHIMLAAPNEVLFRFAKVAWFCCAALAGAWLSLQNRTDGRERRRSRFRLP